VGRIISVNEAKEKFVEVIGRKARKDEIIRKLKTLVVR
jgi:hypothetical protein